MEHQQKQIGLEYFTNSLTQMIKGTMDGSDGGTGRGSRGGHDAGFQMRLLPIAGLEIKLRKIEMSMSL